MNKSAVDLPLSPEESYLASKLLGKSLFSAIQLAKEKELRNRRTYENMDGGDVLQIPIPANMMPSAKVAAHTNPVYSVIESPEGELRYNYTAPEQLDTGESGARNRNLMLGTAAGGMLGGPGGALAGGAAGSLMDSPEGRSGARYLKTIDHLDGSKEHVFAPAENAGLAAHLKRNAGKYIGIPTGALIGGSLPKSLLGKLLGTYGGYAAGGLIGSGIDEANKEMDMADAVRSAKNRQDMLTDVKFRRMMEHEKHAEENLGMFGQAFSTLSKHPARMLLGGQEGFREAKKDYYMQQKAQMQQELMTAQKEYIDLLSRIKTGAAEEAHTPCVDAFCNGVAHAALFGKTASSQDVEISDDSLNRVLANLGRVARKPVDPILSGASTGLLGSAAGSAYLTFLLKKQMREDTDKYMEEKSPTRVELQPYV
jgi:hypothetical protein